MPSLSLCAWGTSYSFCPSRTRAIPGFLGPATAANRCVWSHRARQAQDHRPHHQRQSHRLRFSRSDGHDRASVGDLLSTSSLDEVLRGAHVVLKSAERRVGDYCSTFVRQPDAGADSSGNKGAGNGRRRCWHVYRSLHQARRRLEAEAGAEAVTTGRAGPACADVEALGQLVRELEFVPVEDMCRVLAANERLLGSLAAARGRKRGTWVDRAACPRGSGGGGSRSGSDYEGSKLGSAESEEEEEEEEDEEEQVEEADHRFRAQAEAVAVGVADHTGGSSPGAGGGVRGSRTVGGLMVVEGLDRARAEAVFAALDRSGHGWLDRDDLVAGLDMLGEHLDLSDVEQICMEMGSCGHVDLQAFCDIVEAERLVVPGSDAIFLRHLHHDRPEWWSEPPHFLDAM